MTYQFPPEPTPPQQPRRDPDEWVAVIVALGAIAAILFWVLGKKEGEVGFQAFSSLFAPAETLTEPESTPPAILPESPQTRDRVLPEPEATLPEADEAEDEVEAESSSIGKSEVVEPSPVPDESSETAPSPVAEGSTAAPTPKIEFTDVPEEHWARGAIVILVERGIIEGFPDDTFQPDQPITRAQFAAVVRDVFDRREPSRSAIEFEDVPADFWAASAIDRAVRIEFMKGYPGQVFKPDNQISRTEALVALSAGFELPIPADPEQTLQQYNDREQIPQWATAAIAAASEKGLVVGPPDRTQTLEPTRAATRADVAAMLEQALDLSN